LLTLDIGDGDPLKYYDAKEKMMHLAHDDFKAKRVDDPNMLELEFEDADDDDSYKPI
jgi:hypothetical protein